MTGSSLQRYLNAVAAQPDSGGPAAPAFAARQVSDVMTRAVFAARADTPFKDLAGELDSHHVHGVPVVDDDSRVLGVVTASDLLARVAGTGHLMPRGHRFGAHRATAEKRHGLVAAELMTAPAITVTATATIAAAARLAAKARVRTLPVIDADGRLIGVVTRDDLIRVYLRSDDDIRRDVQRDVIRHLPAVPENAVTVDVEDGIVVLRGTVTTALTAGRVVHQSAQVPGVVDVRDELDFAVDDAHPLAHW